MRLFATWTVKVWRQLDNVTAIHTGDARSFSDRNYCSQQCCAHKKPLVLGGEASSQAQPPSRSHTLPQGGRLLNPYGEGKALGQGDEGNRSQSCREVSENCCWDQTGGMANHPTHLNGMQSLRKEHLYKVLVIGDLGVGKTSIIRRYVHQTYSNNYRATIGVDFALKVLNWDSETVRLQLWDIAGGTVKDKVCCL